NLLIESHDIQQRYISIERAGFAPHRRQHIAGVSDAGTNMKRHFAGVRLRERAIKEWLWIFTECVVLAVLNHAYNLYGPVANREGLAHGAGNIRAWIEATRHCLVNDGDAGRSLIVTIAESAAIEHWYLQRLKVRGINDVHAYQESAFAGLRFPTGKVDIGLHIAAVEWDHARQAGVTNTRQRADAFHELPVKLFSFRV